MNTEKITLSCAIDNWANSDVGLVVIAPVLEPIANCYIIAPGDEVSLPVVKRINQFWADENNGGVQDDKPSVAANGRGYGIDNSKYIGSETWSAEIIWTDINKLGGIASLITLTSGSGDVPLGVKVETGMPHGNIVIGVKKNGNTDYLWSWHLWITDYEPQSGAPASGSGTATVPSGLVIMDRNLGAVNDTPNDVGSFGLLYQWGRKDPFVGASGLSGANLVIIYTKDGTEQVKQVSGDNEGSLVLSISNPVTFYKGNTDDWCYSGELSGVAGCNRWGGSVSHVDPALPTVLGEKTIFDPCPPGWRIPVKASGPAGTADWSNLGPMVNAKSWHSAADYNRGVEYLATAGEDATWLACTGRGSGNWSVGWVGGGWINWWGGSCMLESFSAYIDMNPDRPVFRGPASGSRNYIVGVRPTLEGGS